MTFDDLMECSSNVISDIENIENEQRALTLQLENAKVRLGNYIATRNDIDKKNVLYTKAVGILQKINDISVQKSYRFIEQNLNNALSKIFDETTRKIRLEESTHRNIYPQLDLILEVENGNTRSIAGGSGHGLQQIISFLCILCLIVVSGERRIMVMDEILSGLSAKARNTIDIIMNQFAKELDFQFILIEHGFVPKNSLVYHLEMKDNISRIKEKYIEEVGVADFVE